MTPLQFEILSAAFNDELVHIKEAGLREDIAKRVRDVYDKGSPIGVRRSLGLRTPAAAARQARLNEVRKAAKAQRAAFLAGTRAGPVKMPQPTALQMRQKVQGRLGNVATPASRPSQGAVGPIREANSASLKRMRSRSASSLAREAGGFGRLRKMWGR